MLAATGVHFFPHCNMMMNVGSGEMAVCSKINAASSCSPWLMLGSSTSLYPFSFSTLSRPSLGAAKAGQGNLVRDKSKGV